MHKSFLKRFSIQGLHYYHDFDIEFNEPIKILVGENGLGKTSVLRSLYAILSQQWFMLSRVGFDFIRLEFSNSLAIAFSKSELDAYLLTKYNRLNDVDNLFKKFNEVIGIINQSVECKVIYVPAFRNLLKDLVTIGKSIEQIEGLQRAESSIVTKQGVKVAEEEEEEEVEKDLLIPTDLQHSLNTIVSNSTNNTIEDFNKICNAYLVNTRLRFDKKRNEFSLFNRLDKEKVKFDQLSSGEVQVLYVFTKMFSSPHEVYLLIDEPELHLSLPWQRKFLLDILKTGRCAFLVAATHSPFVFDNSLDKYAQGINVSFKEYGIS